MATFPNLTLDGKVGTGFTIVVTSSDLPPTLTNSIDLTPGSASQLVITQSPIGVLVCAGFGLVVAAEDQSGNVNPAFGGSRKRRHP